MTSSRVRPREALELLRPELAQLEPGELLPLNVDPLEAATTVRGTVPRLRELRAAIIDSFTHFDISHLDRLEVLAQALTHAHTLYLCAKESPEERLRTALKAAELRDLLLSDVSALVKRKRVQMPRLSAGPGRRSYIDLATDVLTLAAVLRGNWETVSSACAATLTELDQAEILCDRLITLSAVRAHTPEALARATQERQQAYTMLVRSYAQVRKAVIYLRTEIGDADTFAPSLRARPSRHKKRSADTPTPTPAPAESILHEASEATPNAEPQEAMTGDPFQF